MNYKVKNVNNNTFSNKFAASKYMNEVLFKSDKQDYAKAACLYNELNRLMSHKQYSNYIYRLIYEDFCNRVEITNWNNIAAKTHLLNILKGVYTKKITDTK